MLDTHAIARALTAAEFTPAQADAITDAVRQATAAGTGTLATKGDVAELKGDVAELKGDVAELKGDVAAIESAIKALEGTTKADVAALERTAKADLRAEVSVLELRLVKWIVGTGLAVAGLVIAGVVAALRLFGGPA